MRKRLFSLIGIFLLLVVAEFLARGCVNYNISNSIENDTTNVGRVQVASGDIPVLFYLGVLGYLSNGTITMHDIVAEPISMSQMSVSAAQLELSRGALVSSRAKVTGKPPYHITVILSPDNLRRELNQAVNFSGTYVQTSVDDHVVRAEPKLDGRFIVLDDGKNEIRIPIPSTDYLPCEPTGIGVSGSIALSCDSDTLPKALAEATK